MSVDPTTLAIGMSAGAAAGLGISYLVFYSSRSGDSRRQKVHVLQRDEEGRLRRKSVSAEELGRSRRDMRTLLLERDLLSGALTKIYEAESDGHITKEEREAIARRYSSQIRDLEAKLRDRELIVEVGELEKLRDELVTMFREKIQNIESRLDQAKERLPAMAPEPKIEAPLNLARPTPTSGGRAEAAAAGISRATSSSTLGGEDLERVVERKTPRREADTEGERRVRAIRDEVMDALAKLEQIDTKKEEAASTPENEAT